MIFNVFYSNDGSANGSHFRLFTRLPEKPNFLEEYAVLGKYRGELAVRFFQQGKPFEFCGAGALCLASALAQDGGAINIVNANFPFAVLRQGGEPMVRIRVEDTSELDSHGILHFHEQQAALRLMPSLDELDRVEIPTSAWQTSTIKTFIAVYFPENSHCIHFRYFTAFNGKGEDQATGSIFRYLAALALDEGRWYYLSQRSVSGASMRCYKSGDQLFYTGNVRQYPIATQHLKKAS